MKLARVGSPCVPGAPLGRPLLRLIAPGQPAGGGEIGPQTGPGNAVKPGSIPLPQTLMISRALTTRFTTQIGNALELQANVSGGAGSRTRVRK